jgi:iron complex outermembrane receptor protein
MAGIPVVAALMAGVTPARANLDTPVEFDMPAGDLSRTLIAISRQGGVMISFPPGIVAGRRAVAIRGRLPVREALARVLSGTGLRIVQGAGGSVTIAAEAGPSPSAAAALGDVAAIDVTDEGALSRFGDVGFQAGNAGETVRIAGAAAKEIPIKVDTVTANVIRSQGILNPLDAAQNVAGVTQVGFTSDKPTFSIRGFQSDALTVNGMGITGYGNNGAAQIPIDDVERVEVLKGPTSILTGATANGGLINVSTKRPTDREIRDVTVRYGSFNYKTLAFDLGGPVAGTEGLTYRFNLAGTHADQNYAGYRDQYETLISPVVRWEDANTSILLGFRYVDRSKPIGQYTFLDPSVTAAHPIFKIPRGTPYFNRDLRTSSRSATVYSDVTHRFDDILGLDTTFNNKLSYDRFSDDLNSFAWLRSRPSRAPQGVYNARQVFNQFQGERFINRSDITLVYDAGFAKQTSTFGIDYQQASVQSSNNLGPITSLNIFAPSVQQQPFRVPPTAPINFSNRDANQIGYYYLEKFDTLDNRLHILGQVRQDQSRSATWSGQLGRANATVNDTSTQGLSWVAGAAFDVTPYFTAYGNRSNGFLPQFGTLGTTGQTAPPEERDQWEVGGRAYLFDKKLSVTASYSDIAATNVTRCDPILGCDFVFLVSGQRSKVFELDFQGEIFPGFNIIGSFASIVAKTSDATDRIVKLDGSPQYTASIWGTYTFPSGPLQAVTLGLGGRGNSRSVGYRSSFTGLFEVPGYVTAEAMIGYDQDRWSVQLQVKNLFDTYAYQPTYAPEYIGLVQGRTVLVQARYSFE